MPPTPKTPARRQRAPASTRATAGPASPIACSSGLSLVQGDLLLDETTDSVVSCEHGVLFMSPFPSAR
eukprot:2656340-Prymnesium_polylepis.1